MSEHSPHVHVMLLADGEVGRLELAVKRHGPVKRLHVLARPSRVELRDAFLSRAQAAVSVVHRSVLPARALSEDGDGPFVEHPHVEGLTAHELAADAATRGEPMPVQIAVRVALQLAEAAAQLERLPGSIAPRFVLVGWDEIVRVTAATIGAGDLGYAAPEVVRGGLPDARSDLFAIGVCLYELLSGARLYPREDSRSSRRILEEPAPDVALEREDVPIPIVELLFELMAKSSAQRPPSAAIAARRLSDALAELVAEEEELAIGPWLEERWSAERDARRRALADAVTPLERAGL